MKILGINGSPRANGNTNALLEKTFEPLKERGWETEIVQVGGKVMRGCLGCRKCFENKDQKCIIANDSFNEVMAKMIEADAIVIGSPTYFTDVTAEVKALIDRAGYVAISNGRIFKGKIGAAVVAVRRAGSLHVFDTINHLFQISQMVIPGSTYWNQGFGLGEGDVERDEEGMRTMQNLGLAIDWLGKAIQPHIKDYPVE